jgi:hypothetical protein
MPQSSPTAFHEAVRGLRENPLPVAFYVAVTTGAMGLGLVAHVLLAPGGLSEAPLLQQKLQPLANDLFQALAWAFAASVAFSRIGRDMDRPLWKVPDDRAALARFFVPWFILALVFTTAGQALFSTINPEEPASILGWLTGVSLVAMWIVPLGACVMFMGRLDWAHLGDALTPLFRQFPLALPFLGLGFLTCFVLSMLFVGESIVLMMLLKALDGLAECLVFAGIWAVCRHDRTHGDTATDDYDF